MERIEYALQHKGFALEDIEAFEKHFGAFPFYRVIEADLREQSVKIATGEHLRMLAEQYRLGSWQMRQKARRVLVQPIDTWRPETPA